MKAYLAQHYFSGSSACNTSTLIFQKLKDSIADLIRNTRKPLIRKARMQSNLVPYLCTYTRQVFWTFPWTMTSPHLAAACYSNIETVVLSPCICKLLCATLYMELSI